nr:hypothetical protein B24H17.70 [imported] - Neurospora crassa [Neurospora crassa]
MIDEIAGLRPLSPARVGRVNWQIAHCDYVTHFNERPEHLAVYRGQAASHSIFFTHNRASNVAVNSDSVSSLLALPAAHPHGANIWKESLEGGVKMGHHLPSEIRQGTVEFPSSSFEHLIPETCCALTGILAESSSSYAALAFSRLHTTLTTFNKESIMQRPTDIGNLLHNAPGL